MATTIYNARGQDVGSYNNESKIYFSIRDASKNQVFIHEGHHGYVALDSSILKKLVQMGCKEIHLLIINYDNKPTFLAKIFIDEFLSKSQKIDYDRTIDGVPTKWSPQRRCHLDMFQVEQRKQKTIKQYVQPKAKPQKPDNHIFQEARKDYKENKKQAEMNARLAMKKLKEQEYAKE